MLGPPLTAQDATAPSITPVLTRATPRQLPLDKPVPLDKPLPPLGQHLLGVAIALDTHITSHVPDIDPRTATGRQANDYLNDRTTRIFPGLVPRPF
jgi:hypothetical protein